MSGVNVVVKGRSDLILLNRLLDDLKPLPVSFFDGKSHNHAWPVAAQLLTTERLPTALVLDANSTDPDRIREERHSLLDYLHSVAGGVPYTLMMFEPSIEVIFFDCPGVLRRRLGREVEPNLLALARYAPKQALEMLLADTPPQLLFLQLDDTDLAELRQHPMVVKLRQFVSTPYGSTQLAAK